MLRRLYVCHSYIFRHMRSNILFYCTEYSTCFQNRSARELISTEDYQDDIESFADSGIQAQGLLVVGQRHGRVSHQRHFGAAASRFPIRRQGYPFTRLGGQFSKSHDFANHIEAWQLLVSSLLEQRALVTLHAGHVGDLRSFTHGSTVQNFGCLYCFHLFWVLCSRCYLFHPFRIGGFWPT